eukprot:CAMPEP_0115544502 /NCGR_PEP_ID=MMETSP0271-20121206/92121_1 /TAXON_ID=71861 /ORGANISM="Scrippsiella trochoidea, Strain CCMP3099" /LENGTH=41 /DNA_ID= /DNA_START= /DNA_END= /DNA_ORIENTATION=
MRLSGATPYFAMGVVSMPSTLGMRQVVNFACFSPSANCELA